MFFSKSLKNFNKINYGSKIIRPVLKKDNVVLIYWYRFLKNRLELITNKGIVVNLKRKQNLLNVGTITLKHKLGGITVFTKYQLNNIALIGIRLIKN